MRARTLLVFPALVAFSGAGGFATCQMKFQQDAVAIETRIAALVARIKADAPIVLADIQTGISLACSVAPLIQQNAANVQSAIASPTADVQKALNAAAQAGAVATAACTKYSATQSAAPTVSAAGNTLLSIWNAYVAGKNALTAAQAAAS
jgi:hypothetical protein